MADNVSTVASVSGVPAGTQFSFDDIGGGLLVQRVKVQHGVDGAAVDASASNPFPVDVTELTTADLDTGAGTDTKAVVGIALAGSGGSQLLPGDATNGLKAQISSAPAAGRTTDSIAVAPQTDAIMNGLTALTPKFAKIVASASGATTIVAAVASKKIRVVKWAVVCNAAVNVKWQSHVTPTDLTGLHYFAANGGITEAYCPVGHFETVAGEALDINLSGAVAVGGSLVYVEV